VELSMSTVANQERLQNCRNTSELRTLIAELCGELAEVLSVTAICSQDRDNMMCVIDFAPGTPNLAAVTGRIGGHVFGFNSVVIRLAPQAGFACPNGYPPKNSTCSCTPRS